MTITRPIGYSLDNFIAVSIRVTSGFNSPIRHDANWGAGFTRTRRDIAEIIFYLKPPPNDQVGLELDHPSVEPENVKPFREKPPGIF